MKTRSTVSLFDVTKWSAVLIFSRMLELVLIKLHMKLELSNAHIVFSITVKDFSNNLSSQSFHHYNKVLDVERAKP